MSHVAVRIVSNWLQDATYGVAAIAAALPRDGTDPAPDPVHVYDDTRHGWAARQQIPKPLGTAIQFPAIVVSLQGGTFDGGAPEAQDTGARTIYGSVQVLVQLLYNASATDAAATSAMYVLRAIRNSLLQLDEPSRDAQRTLTGVRLQPSTRVTQGRTDAQNDDTVLAAGAFVVSYDTLEVTALTLDVN